ncbi:MAG: head GIN domain-containing protein [Flavobacteriales bacterium]
MKNHLKISFLIISLICFSITNAQKIKSIKGNGNITTQTKTTKVYDIIKVVGFMDVELVAGEEGNITVTTDENLQEYVVLETQEDELIIKIKKHIRNLKTKYGIHVTVPFKDIHKVILTGSGDITSKDTISGTQFTTSLTGSGDINLKINSQNTEASISGSGDLIISGSTQKFTLKLSGSGDFKGKNFLSNNIKVSLTGSGDASVNTDNHLKARVYGSGDINYTGNPKTIDKKVYGSGDITAF